MERKFRLRLLFQEIDLHPGNFVIGRSSACNLTVEDPLVSREHARILVYPDRAEVHDMGSRNGTQLNGREVTVGELLRHGDRLRIGSYEFIFIVELPHLNPSHPQTMRSYRCQRCATPYTEGADSCPSCGAPVIETVRMNDQPTSDDTGSFSFDDPFMHQKSQMIDEVLNMAISMGHWEKAEGFLDTKIAGFEKSASEGPLNRRELLHISEYCLTVAHGLRDGSRIDWLLDAWSRCRHGMPVELLASLEELARDWYDLNPALERYLDALVICDENEKTRLSLLNRLRRKPEMSN